MCNFDRVVGFLILAKIAYVAMIAFLVIAAVASGGIFSAGAAVGPMIAASLSLAATTGLFTAALVNISNCRGPCNTELDNVRGLLIATIAVLGTVLTVLIVLTVVAPVPVAGAVAITSAMIWLTTGAGVLITIESLISIRLAIAFESFNSCQARNNAPNGSTATTAFTVLTVIGVVGGFVVGGASGGLLSLFTGLLVAGALFGFGVNFSFGEDADKGENP
jgi:hypothetical protein